MVSIGQPSLPRYGTYLTFWCCGLDHDESTSPTQRRLLHFSMFRAADGAITSSKKGGCMLWVVGKIYMKWIKMTKAELTEHLETPNLGIVWSNVAQLQYQPPTASISMTALGLVFEMVLLYYYFLNDALDLLWKKKPVSPQIRPLNIPPQRTCHRQKSNIFGGESASASAKRLSGCLGGNCAKTSSYSVVHNKIVLLRPRSLLDFNLMGIYLCTCM